MLTCVLSLRVSTTPFQTLDTAIIQCTAYVENKYLGTTILIIVTNDNDKNYRTRKFVFIRTLWIGLRVALPLTMNLPESKRIFYATHANFNFLRMYTNTGNRMDRV